MDKAHRHVGELAELRGLRPGSHVCCVLDSAAQFDSWTTECLAEGYEAGQKLFRFTPSPFTSPHACVTVLDPRHAFLDSGPLVAATLYTVIRRESAQARHEGYRGLRLITDMDWLLPQPPTAPELFAFELMLDEVVTELDATVVCAYRAGHYAADSLAELVAVHPLSTGRAPNDLNFRMWNVDLGTWALSGEIDILNSEQFHRALATASAHGPLRRLVLGGLTFIAADGIAALAEAAATQPEPIVIQAASTIFRQCWEFLGLGEHLPHVSFEGMNDDQD